MRHDDLLITLNQSATIKLLQAQNAPLILSFLYDQFKRGQQITISHPLLAEALEAYLDALHESYPDSYTANATYYLRLWCDDDHRFLRRYYVTDTDAAVYELTPDTERALSWVEELQKNDFIGTESRFLRIFDLLQEIVTYSTEDINLRLAQLEKEKAKIQAEIDQLTSTGHVEQYSQTQIKERFFEANDVARRLLADFREIEENFRHLARQVQEQRYALDLRKGQIVGHVLDADAALKESDQGRSFYTFWEFLISAQRQDELQELLNAIYQLPDLNQINATKSHRLRRLKRDLIDAATKIIESNRHLGEQLRNLLDEQNLLESRRVMDLAADIKRQAIHLVDNPPPDKAFWAIEDTPIIDMPWQRPLWSPSTTNNFATIEPQTATIDLATADLDTLFNQFYVDEYQLRRHIATLLESTPTVTLGQILATFPLQQGLAELITYFALATRDENHQIQTNQWEEIKLDENGRLARIPLIHYHKQTTVNP
ncbi:MAG TPA: DUF3375 domain-containing protein [Anaerolineae bacterium]|nr:DUF3375 domain-containing protein [Anaerolineae bacterium]